MPQSPQPGIRYAMLAAQRQDIRLQVPDQIIVAATRVGEVFVITAPRPSSQRSQPVTPCSGGHERKAEAALAAYYASGLKNQQLFADTMAFGFAGDGAFCKCFAERFKD